MPPNENEPLLLRARCSVCPGCGVGVTSELILEDVRVPKDAILPGVKGMKGPLSCLTAARFGIAPDASGQEERSRVTQSGRRGRSRVNSSNRAVSSAK